MGRPEGSKKSEECGGRITSVNLRHCCRKKVHEKLTESFCDEQVSTYGGGPGDRNDNEP